MSRKKARIVITVGQSNGGMSAKACTRTRNKQICGHGRGKTASAAWNSALNDLHRALRGL